jgi:protein O-GlcNAc transferase
MTATVPLFKRARVWAQRGNFTRLLEVCRQLQQLCSTSQDASGLVDTGTILLGAGFLSAARECFEQAHRYAPHETAAPINLANVARETGQPELASRFYDELLQRLPDDAVVWRNFLVNLEYDPTVSDAKRFEQALAWGQWAIARAGGSRPRPPKLWASDRPLRVGYVSADFCQHTVGLLVKDTLKSHDRSRITPVAYHAGRISDWVTNELRASLLLRDVASLDDVSLAELIRRDQIDVLVDLSGHTAGSRLTVFAHRPAPVQVSWLGYFATTGLETIDAVLLDDTHANAGAEAHFVERIIRLGVGRWCYQPLLDAPAVAESPAKLNGYVTFGSFNNTAKYHADVHALWARVLAAVPHSRLVLKWRTFNDELLCRETVSHYVARGIAADRIELRGPSFHNDVLASYADIDIALDPFPFTGGLTSCEALWMGVPVVTMPQTRVVSRQTASLLNTIGLTEWVANDADAYVAIAAKLASDHRGRALTRTTLRDKMTNSPLMNQTKFVQQLESALIGAYHHPSLN